MKKLLFIYIILTISGCVTETTYSSHMYGNNQETVTVGKNNKLESSSGSSLLHNDTSNK